MALSYWINTTDYTNSQLLWNGIGCCFWLIAYIALIKSIVAKKFVEIPFLIAVGNISWEFIWGFIYHPTTGHAYALSYQGGFILDIFIFYNVFRYGYKQVTIPEIQKHFKLILVFLLIIWVPLNYFFVAQGFDTPIGANSGYILNFIISCLYPLLLLRNKASDFSPTVAWCKFIGTGCITVSIFLIYPKNYFVQILGAACFVLDLMFAIFLTNKLRKIN
jgi:hypothetical protein